MVSLPHIRSSNTTAIPPGLIALFVGGTSGIGQATVKALSQYATNPRIYIAGRSRTAADALIADCKATNPQGEYTFVEADVTLIGGADRLCNEMKKREERLDLLFLTVGQSDFSRTVTSDGLHLLAALNYYSRIRITQNLLPLLQRSTSLRRVVSVGGGTHEGSLNTSDLQALKVAPQSLREHLSTLVTLGLESVARTAPGVSFIHSYPGTVKTPLLKNMPEEMLKSLTFMPIEECGERNLYLATSSRFTPREALRPVRGEEDVGTGNDGKRGSGFYSVGEDCESASREVVDKLEMLREEGMVDLVAAHTRDEFTRIEGEKGHDV